MRLINQIVEGDYTINIYDNGVKKKFLTAFPPKIVQPPILTEIEQATYQTAANVEMLVALSELG